MDRAGMPCEQTHLRQILDERVAGVGAGALIVEGLVGDVIDARHVHILLLRAHDLREGARDAHRPLELLDALDELHHALIVVGARQAQVSRHLGIAALGLRVLVLWEDSLSRGKFCQWTGIV